MKLTSTHYYAIFFVIIIAGGLFVATRASDTGPSKLDGLAQCINDSGAKFYGAFWCPHCADQKRAFGGAQKLLPYIECSTPDSQGQTQVCIDAEIESYPTWELSDGTRLPGVVSPAELAEATGCELPTDDES